jgi:DNA polymerase III epsilon subunit-like protein
VDVETTGINPDGDKIIELGICLFEYDRQSGRIYKVLGSREWLEALLNNLSPGNRALGYRRVIPLIGIAPIPNRRCGRTGIGGITIAIVIATVIGSRC